MSCRQPHAVDPTCRCNVREEQWEGLVKVEVVVSIEVTVIVEVRFVYANIKKNE